MKLEVGMYCYNKTNRKLGIGKIISFQCNNNVNIKYKNDIELVSAGNVIASFNMIDLIEVGDYINGQEVYYDEELDYLYVQCIDGDGNLYCESITKQSFINNIKSIVTHEQFEQMSYKLG